MWLGMVVAGKKIAGKKNGVADRGKTARKTNHGKSVAVRRAHNSVGAPIGHRPNQGPSGTGVEDDAAKKDQNRGVRIQNRGKAGEMASPCWRLFKEGKLGG